MIGWKDGAFLGKRNAPGARPSSARFALLRFAPALRGDRRISSEGDVVLELLRDARRRPPALGRAGARGGGAVAGVAAEILRRSDLGPAAPARAAQERELAAEAGHPHPAGRGTRRGRPDAASPQPPPRRSPRAP